MSQREFQVYQGAMPQAEQVRVPQVPSVGELPNASRDVAAAVEQLQEVGLRVGRLHDLGVQQRVTQQRNKLRSDLDVKLQQAAALPMGSPESLFRADGSINQDRCDALTAEFRDACDRMDVGEFWLRENAVRYAGEQEAERTGVADRVGQFAALKSIASTRKAFADNLELAVGREDWEAARGMVRDAQGVLLSDAEAGVELQKLSRKQLQAVSRSAGYGYPSSVNVGGREYSGLSAALAMEDARGAGTQGGAGDAPVRDDVPSEMMPHDGGDAPASQDIRGLVSTMPQNEFDGVSDAFAFDARVLTMPRDDGGVVVSAAPYAPECVQRAAAVGNARGGIDGQQARMMVARIALDAVADNPDVTAAAVVGMFDESGIYEAMGDGDAAVGAERCRAVVSEGWARGRGDSNKLGMSAIEPMLKAHLSSREFAASREWGRVAELNPLLDKGQEWDKSDLDDAGRKRWFALYDVYRKYRAEYKPDAAGELDKDEFEEEAQAFYDWYVKNKLPGLRRADMEAAGDWYRLQIVSRLRERVYEDGGKAAYAGYPGYGADVQVARDVLRMSPPERLGADELMEVSRKMQAMDAARSKKFRQRAQDDYARLRELKADAAAHSESAARRREREQKAEERKAEKAARDAEKQAEREAARRLFVARSAPREAEWVWDGQNAPDGAQPGCALPEAEYKRLYDELGYDGSQLVYVQVNGARVLVTGVSNSGRMELNAPAVAKVQKKPNRKNGERWRTSGRLGYSYYFHSAKAE